MSYEEFKNIVSLLQSPDIEVVELGRLMVKELSNISIWTAGCITHMRFNNGLAVFHPWTMWPEEFIKQLYADIFRI